MTGWFTEPRVLDLTPCAPYFGDLPGSLGLTGEYIECSPLNQFLAVVVVVVVGKVCERERLWFSLTRLLQD